MIQATREQKGYPTGTVFNEMIQTSSKQIVNESLTPFTLDA